MTKKIKFSSPQPTGAIISQFYLALEKCFEMREGEFVYIEKDGDVSKINPLKPENGEQIELKEYSKDNDLTNSHSNFWNTLKNWIDSGFNSDKYKYLILATTQEIGVNSSLKDWNKSDYDQRLQILNEIFSKANDKYQKALVKNKKANKPEVLLLMDKVFQKKAVLEKIINKILIDSNRTRRSGIDIEIQEKHLKTFSEDDRNRVLNSIMGYVIRTENYNMGWEVSYNGFSQELQDLSSIYNSNSKIFPVDDNLKAVPHTEKVKIKEYTFVKKIKEIEYDEVITGSLNDYWFTLNTILNEFKNRKQKESSLKKFEDDLLTIHNAAYRIASRKTSLENLVNDSKDFYDDIIGRQSPNLDIYNNTPLIFKNGMYHLLADEENDKIVWKLNLKRNE